MKIKFCGHCYLSLGEAEKPVKIGGEVYHRRCWDLIEKMRERANTFECPMGGHTHQNPRPE